jgi:hypothetical protein
VELALGVAQRLPLLGRQDLRQLSGFAVDDVRRLTERGAARPLVQPPVDVRALGGREHVVELLRRDRSSLREDATRRRVDHVEARSGGQVDAVDRGGEEERGGLDQCHGNLLWMWMRM